MDREKLVKKKSLKNRTISEQLIELWIINRCSVVQKETL